MAMGMSSRFRRPLTAPNPATWSTVPDGCRWTLHHGNKYRSVHGRENFRQRVDKVLKEIRTSGRAHGVERLLTPGEIEEDLSEQREHGSPSMRKL